jgi:transposase InsO family protein
MDERMRFVMDVLRGQDSKGSLCRQYGISRPTGDKWLWRYEELGVMGFEDQSRAPQRHPNEVRAELVELILACRRAHPRWGPKKLRATLVRRMPEVGWPCPSTMGQMLHRAGLTVPRKRRHRTPPYTQPFAVCDGPNGLWCVDFKGWFRTSDGSRCDPLTLSDAYSRYLLRLQVMPDTKDQPVRSVMEAAFREYGLPTAIRSDNGPPFASRGIGGLSHLSVWWLKLGIVAERIEPAQPQQNGRHERMHLTLKGETACPPARTLRAQQDRFDAFRREYNNSRPHEALDQRYPGELYRPSPRPYPDHPRLEYGPGMEVRSVKGNGVLNWRGQVVFLGEALSRERVGLAEVADGCWGVYFGRHALGIVDQRLRKVVDAGEAVRKGWVSESALRSPFRYAPGAPEGASNM